MDVAVKVLDLMYTHFFHCQMMNSLKMLFFGVDSISSAHIGTRKKDILVLGEAK